MAAIVTRIVSGDCVRYVNISRQGGLKTVPLEFDQAKFQSLSVDDQAFNFFGPTAHKQFVVRGAVVFGNRDIADNSDTIIVIYEADSATSTTVDKVLIQFGLGRLTALSIVPLNLLVSEGVFVNAKTTDNTVNMTIMGFFVKVVP